MLLLLLIIIPFFGGILSWQFERLNINLPRITALITMGINLILVIILWGKDLYNKVEIDKKHCLWGIEYLINWIPRFGISIHLAIDGLSLLMITLSIILGVLAILSSWKEIQRHQGIFYFYLLCIVSIVIGLFLSIDMFLFFFFWEILSIPIYFLIILWDYPFYNKKIRIISATKFFIYTQISGLIMLSAILGLVLMHYKFSGIWTFNYQDLLDTPMSKNIEFILMLGFFIAFAIKFPIIPLHGWLQDTHSNTPNSGSVDIVGLLLKTSAYGLLRFNLTLFPNASNTFIPIAMSFGLVGIFYGAFLAFSQTDIKRWISYANLSHMGYVLIGIYSRNQFAYQGVVLQIIAYSLSSSGMFIVCGQLYERIHTKNIYEMGGIWKRMHILPALSLYFSASMLGLPGTGNFIGEIITLLGSFPLSPVIVVCSTFGIVFASIYSLIITHRIYYGKSISDVPLKNMSFREKIIMFSLILLNLQVGLFPQPIINIAQSSLHNIYQITTNNYYITHKKY